MTSEAERQYMPTRKYALAVQGPLVKREFRNQSRVEKSGHGQILNPTKVGYRLRLVAEDPDVRTLKVEVQHLLTATQCL